MTLTGQGIDTRKDAGKDTGKGAGKSSGSGVIPRIRHSQHPECNIDILHP